MREKNISFKIHFFFLAALISDMHLTIPRIVYDNYESHEE